MAAGRGTSAGVRRWCGPHLERELCSDFDAAITITIAHSEKENTAATWKRTLGFHPLLAFLNRPNIAAGQALAGLLRPGNAGSTLPPTTTPCWTRHRPRCPSTPDPALGRRVGRGSWEVVPRVVEVEVAVPGSMPAGW
ncbi:MAG: hypothetical protein DLM56_13580 [Pseudonocardiales bacterium]|nr:MAG: hypothetical protein DLM56_13580 [Pseudonocardiales bacterium]